MVLTTQYHIAVTSKVSPIKKPADLCWCAAIRLRLTLALCFPPVGTVQRQPRAENLNKRASPTVSPNYGGVGRILNHVKVTYHGF